VKSSVVGRRAIRWLRSGGAVLAGLLLLAGCGSNSEKPSSAGTTNAASTTSPGKKPLSYFRQRAATLYKGTYIDPDPGPKPPTGKKIAVVSYGLASPYSARYVNALKMVAAKVGWTVKVFDGKFQPNLQVTAIRSAVAEKVDAIVLSAITCPTVKAALVDAKKADIPVLGVESQDCSDAKPGTPSYFASQAGLYNSAPYGGLVAYTQWGNAYGRASADMIANALNGQANVLNTYETDVPSMDQLDAAFLKQLNLCGGCKVVATVRFNGNDLAGGLQQKVATALVQHPNINAVYGIYDAPVTGGIAAAVKASGRPIYVTGGEGDPPNISLIREGGGQSVALGPPPDQESWSTVGQLGRIFRGQPKEVANGIGYQAVDKSHNLPPVGEGFEGPIDFAGVYSKAWGVGG
jgi:ribose transport system substrate-binding protein